uniref:Uncharacterized protein n=1 Tax=Heliothis virescens TaxID=7102 RepID=A0A2A4JI75_HELVI
MASVSAVVVYIFTILAILCEVKCQVLYVPKIEALSPTELRLTVEYTGFQVFSFQGNINTPIKVGDEGSLSLKLLSRPAESKTSWSTFKDIEPRLKTGDIIYYYVYFITKKGTINYVSDFEYKVTNFVNEDGTSEIIPTSSSSTPTLDTTSNSISHTTPPCTLSITEIKGRKPICKGSLIFNEEFEQSHSKELTQWDPLNQFLAEPDYPFNMYQPYETISLENGSLVIKPVFTDSKLLSNPSLDLADRCTGKFEALECKREGPGIHNAIPPVTTGKITTRTTFSFKYGRVEVRAKLPSGTWILPEINLEPTDHVYGSKNYSSGLVRIAFLQNDGDPGLRKYVVSGLVFSGSNLYSPVSTDFIRLRGDEDWNEDYHVYSVTWTPEKFIFHIDNNEIGHIGYFKSFAEDKAFISHASNWTKGSKMAPFDEMFHVTLGLRVGGVNEFKDSEKKPWKNLASKAMLQFWKAKDEWFPSWTDGAMKIDYVKVYAL